VARPKGWGAARTLVGELPRGVPGEPRQRGMPTHLTQQRQHHTGCTLYQLVLSQRGRQLAWNPSTLCLPVPQASRKPASLFWDCSVPCNLPRTVPIPCPPRNPFYASSHARSRLTVPSVLKVLLSAIRSVPTTRPARHVGPEVHCSLVQFQQQIESRVEE